MSNKLLKITISGLFMVLAAVYCFHSKSALADADGPLTSRTGAPSELTCNASGCHSGNALNEASGSLTISGLPAGGYSPSQEITLTVTLRRPSGARYGFELTALDDQGRRAGDLVVTESGRTQLKTGTVSGGARQYIEHTQNGTIPNGSGQNSWTLKWRAPAASVGKVTFYAAGNAANGNGQDTGDFIYTTNASVQPAGALATATAVSAASYAQGALASETIAALYGTNLAADKAVSTALPLPTTLGGVTVKVKDAASVERDASLFFVSGGQINLMIPAGTSNGAANLTVLRDNTAVAAGTVTIES